MTLTCFCAKRAYLERIFLHCRCCEKSLVDADRCWGWFIRAGGICWDDGSRPIDRQPDLAFAYIVRGILRAELVEDRNGAIDDYSQVIELEPDRALGYYFRAKNRFRLGDPKGAIEDFDRAIQLQPNYVNAYLCRGTVRASLGDRQGASDDRHQAIVLGPDTTQY